MTSVTRLISWNQWRVEATPQRAQTDCTGRNCRPQFSQKKCASQIGFRILPLDEWKTNLDYLRGSRTGYCTLEQVCRIRYLLLRWREFHLVKHADVPAAILLGHGRDHDAFARRPRRAVRGYRPRDHRIGIDGSEAWREKANALHRIRAARVFEVARE